MPKEVDGFMLVFIGLCFVGVGRIVVYIDQIMDAIDHRWSPTLTVAGQLLVDVVFFAVPMATIEICRLVRQHRREKEIHGKSS